MSTNVKNAFIAQLRETPEGIQNFLNKALPTPPNISLPNDVDSAIIATGVLAKYLLDLFAVFAGLTPIELLLRLGQHSNVAEALLFAALQYLGASNAQNDAEILAPTEGKTYAPGNVLFRVQAKNGTLQSVLVNVWNKSLTLTNHQGVFEGTIALQTEGAYSATFHLTFKDADPQTATCAFTIAAVGDPEPELPGGKDKAAVDRALADCAKYYQQFIKIIAYTTDQTALTTAYNEWKAAIDTFSQTAHAALGQYAGVLAADDGYLQNARAKMATAIVTGEHLAATAGALESVIDHMDSIVEDLLK